MLAVKLPPRQAENPGLFDMEIQGVRFLLNGLMQPLLQTKNRSRINKVLFLFLETAWNSASF